MADTTSMGNGSATHACDCVAAPLPDPALCEPAFVLRQPLLDAGENIAGYELKLDQDEDLAGGARCTPQERSARLLSLLATLEIQRIAEHKPIMVTLDGELLLHGGLDQLPRDSMILAIRLPPVLPLALVSVLRDAWSKGFCLALDDCLYATDRAYLLETAAYVRLDVARCNGLELARHATALLEKSGARLIAANIRTRDEFEACRSLPFDYYAGEFFTASHPKPDPRLEHERTHLIGLLNQVRQHAELTAIERGFRRDPTLIYRLLRYINSPGLGLNHEIRSVAHALVVLGYRQLYRWLTLLLFACGPDGGRNRALLTHALIRGRLVELLGQHALGETERDSLFIAGIFSLLEALLGIPLRQALAAIHLPAALQAALLDQSGIYAPCLQLALACESGDQARLRELAAECRLDAAAVNAAHVQALLWAESIA